MVFQGTVWGPMLWNVFYEDASKAIRSKAFTEIVFADDLNAFRKYDSKAEMELFYKIWKSANWSSTSGGERIK